MTILFDYLRLLCEVLSLIILVRVILSWVMPRPNTLTNILDRITEPILSPIRHILPATGMFDFSPLVAMILLQLIARLIP